MNIIHRDTVPAGDDPDAPLSLAIVNAGVSSPSTSRMLADRIAERSIHALRDAGVRAQVTDIDLAPIAAEIGRSIAAGFTTMEVQAAIDRLAQADAIIASTPVYKAGISGLFKSFVDLIDNDLVIAKPVVLAATGGTGRHAMVVDEQLRPLFAFLRAIPVPTSLYAAPEDWASPELGKRISRAATELAALLRSGAPQAIADENWHGYQHQFGGNATRAERSSADVDLTTDLMRLAAGGKPARSDSSPA